LHWQTAYQICRQSEPGMFWAELPKRIAQIATDVFSAEGAVQLLAWGIAPGIQSSMNAALKARFSVQFQTYRSSKSTPCATTQDRRLHKVLRLDPLAGRGLR